MALSELRRGPVFWPVETVCDLLRRDVSRGELVGYEVEEGGDGADEVELDDGTPALLLLLPRLVRVRQLEVYSASDDRSQSRPKRRTLERCGFA